MRAPEPRCQPEENNGACHITTRHRLLLVSFRAESSSVRCSHSYCRCSGSPRHVAVQPDQLPTRRDLALVGDEPLRVGRKVEVLEEIDRLASWSIMVAANHDHVRAMAAPGGLEACGQRAGVSVFVGHVAEAEHGRAGGDEPRSARGGGALRWLAATVGDVTDCVHLRCAGIGEERR